MDNDTGEVLTRDQPRSSPRDRSKRPYERKKKMKNSLSLVGPAEAIGEGDSFIRCPVVSASTADSAFYTLKKSVEWQKMFHRSGEVPRLVAVQGEIDEDDESEPIYRHPADESPEMLPFDNTVDMLRTACEKLVGHDLNHVLIQYYRSGEDNISEHSDKTLDIVRGSSVVNLSLGAQRIMTIRTKKDTTIKPTSKTPDLPHSHTDSFIDAAVERITQRIPLMHNSLFILGPLTNQYWLHSVRADKRPASERSAEELAYGGERISLTFRQIGTFVDKKRKLIWGQGARGKTREDAGKLLEGPEADREGERMIKAFGMENHQAGSWSWDEGYGGGFDVVNFETGGE
jgi:alkylated DNA repair dioxygenase AlkB